MVFHHYPAFFVIICLSCIPGHSACSAIALSEGWTVCLTLQEQDPDTGTKGIRSKSFNCCLVHSVAFLTFAALLYKVPIFQAVCIGAYIAPTLHMRLVIQNLSLICVSACYSWVNRRIWQPWWFTFSCTHVCGFYSVRTVCNHIPIMHLRRGTV